MCDFSNYFCNDKTYMEWSNMTKARPDTHWWDLVLEVNNRTGFSEYIWQALKDFHDTHDKVYSDFRMLEFAIFSIVGPIICGLGILGNALSVVVLQKDDVLKRTTRFLLQSLAVSDLLFLLITMVFGLLRIKYPYADWATGEAWNHPYIRAYIAPLWHIARTCTVWMVVLVTADRYIAICQPLKAASYSTSSRMKTAVLAICILSCFYNLPRFFERRIYFLENVNENITSAFVRETSLERNEQYRLIYGRILYIMFMLAIPLCSLVFFNTSLILAVRKSIQTRKTMFRTSSHKEGGQQERYTIMLISVVILFIICQTPALIVVVWSAILPTGRVLNLYGKQGIFMRVLVFVDLFLVINSSINFVVYFLAGRNFRKALYKLLCRCGKGNEVRSVTTRTTRTT